MDVAVDKSDQLASPLLGRVDLRDAHVTAGEKAVEADQGRVGDLLRGLRPENSRVDLVLNLKPFGRMT
jgi:hypothetical protein